METGDLQCERGQQAGNKQSTSRQQAPKPHSSPQFTLHATTPPRRNMEEANKLIGAGKKHLVMGKVVEAVGALQEACGVLAKKYGDTADECGEAFFWCGKALLDLARMENSVLGNALEGVPEEEEEEKKPKDPNFESPETVDEKTRDELRVQVYDAMAEKKSEAAQKAEGKQEPDAEVKAKESEAKKKEEDEQKKMEVEEGEKKSDADADEDDENKENVAVKEPAEKREEAADKTEKAESDDEEEEEEEEEDGDDDAEEGEAEEGGDDAAAEKGSDDEEEDEVGNLQLAWEMLEVAKVIYTRKEAKEDQLMAAQTHLKLGEVSAETGNYTQALEDFQECLKLQLKHLDADSRLLAETHYQLGLTFSLNLQYKEAVQSLRSSISVINSRLGKLTELIAAAAGPEELPEERKEMEELKALLPEIQEKVEDATEGMKTASADSEAVKKALDGGSTSSAFPGTTAQNGATSSSATKATSPKANGHASTAPVSNISHLVRKKRKPEESPVKEEAAAVKKLKQEPTQINGKGEGEEPHTNGVHKANGDTNGHTNGMEVESQ